MQSIISIITLLLPTILKIVGYLIDKKNDSDALKEEFLKFLNSIEKDVPLKLRKDYLDQISKIRERLRLEEIQKIKLIEEHTNYKQAYEDLQAKYDALYDERVVR